MFGSREIVFLFLLVAPLQQFQPASCEATYYIKPAEKSSCHYDDCYTLTEITNEPGRYFSSNMTLVFLHGIHILDSIFYLANTESLTLLGTEAASTHDVTSTVLCTGGSGLVLRGISKVEIKELRFQSCGSRKPTSPSNLPGDFNFTVLWGESYQVLPSISALFLPNFQLTSCRMESNCLPLFAYGSSVISHGNTFKGSSGKYGGAVLVRNSSIAFVEMNLFQDNEATYYGGGICSLNSELIFRASATFVRNHATLYGGGIAATNSTVNFEQATGTKYTISFIENSASYSGGGIFLNQSSMNHTMWKLNFTGNAAYFSGGGLRAERGSFAALNGYTLFKSNWVITGYGGAVYVRRSTLIFIVITFEGNRAESGGAVSLEHSILHAIRDASFLQNSVERRISFTSLYNHNLPQWPDIPDRIPENGGAVSAKDCNASFNGKSTFVNNTADSSGGAIFISKSTVNFAGNTSFQRGMTRQDGGGIYVQFGKLHFTGHTVFMGNLAWGNGGGLGAAITEVHFKGCTRFIGNEGFDGGGINVWKGTVSLTGSTCNTFTGNKAWSKGGGIHLDLDGFMEVKGKGSFTNNSAGTNGGAINIENYSKATIEGVSKFINNSAMFGGAVSVVEGTCTLTGELAFVNNSGTYGGAMFIERTSLTLNGTYTFDRNMAKSGYGGGIRALRSKIELNGTYDFVNNSARYGGGLAISHYVSPELLLFLTQNTSVRFRHNHATKYGGALFVEESSSIYCDSDLGVVSIPKIACFFQIKNFNCKQDIQPPFRDNTLLFFEILYKHNAHLVFERNTAEEGGNALYGGALERCGVCYDEFQTVQSGPWAFSTLADTSLEMIKYPGSSVISSDPVQVCFCESLETVCAVPLIYTLSVYPGETLLFPVITVGQLQGVVAGVIHARSNNQELALADKLQYTQTTNTSCTFLEYTLLLLKSPQPKVNLDLFAEGPCSVMGHPLRFVVKFLACPAGFALSQGACGCDRRLQKYTNSCDINDKSITRSRSFWVGLESTSNALIFHPHCPFDYCKSGRVSFTFDTIDLQCAHNRSGVLCGACSSGLSLNFGESQCSSCSNLFLLLLLPFAIAGFLLVTFLFIFKVTVAAGTSSGLIFYANVVVANRTVFFPRGETNILTVFIAWLNLDLGIETCFFDGMDAYSRTWLQFLFPFYIWSLVGLITLVSYYSMTVARIIGPTNPVSVLATLFLLSYTKLLRTIIATFSFTTLDYPNDQKVYVWAYDGNIGFLEGKHVALFIAGLLAFLLLFLPYTLLLLFGQCIVAGSNHKLFRWANNPKVRSLLDAYHAPFKNHHRYWVGLLLLLRFVLLVISAVIDINSPRDPSVNLLALATMCIGLAIWTWNVGSMYKAWHNNILESSFILNLAILAAVSYQVKVEGGSKQAAVHTSVVVVFVTFLGITMYHLVKSVTESRIWRISVRPKFHKIRQTFTRHRNEDVVEMPPPPIAPAPHVTTTFVELREPLLDS